MRRGTIASERAADLAEDDIALENAGWLHLRATARVSQAFAELNLFVNNQTQMPVNPDALIKIPKSISFESYTSCHGVMYSAGAFTFSENPLTEAIAGRYCSIARGLSAMGERHPIEEVTSSSFTYAYFPHFKKAQFARAHERLLNNAYPPKMPGIATGPLPVLEHDVWIGQQVILARGITLHTGCVVGAGSVVTKDVPPYTIVAGNPARFVRLVPRQRWNWEDIVRAMQGDPAMQPMLRAAYLQWDVGAVLQRYRESEEFRDLAALIRSCKPHARTMLDVGAGNGVVAVAFALEGFDVTALEPSRDALVGCGAISRMVDAAVRVDASVRTRVRIVNSGVEQADLDARFDAIVCRQATHHFPQPVLALRKLRGVIEADGVAVLVREHVIFDDDDLKAFLDSHPMHRFYGGERAYTQAAYEAFAREAGFHVAKVLRFKESPINYWPHAAHDVADLDERDIAGRPYTFALRVEEPGTCAC